MGKDGLQNFPLNRSLRASANDGNGHVSEIVTKELDQPQAARPRSLMPDPNTVTEYPGMVATMTMLRFIRTFDVAKTMAPGCGTRRSKAGIIAGSRSTAPADASTVAGPSASTQLMVRTMAEDRVEEFLGDLRSLEASQPSIDQRRHCSSSKGGVPCEPGGQLPSHRPLPEQATRCDRPGADRKT